ncbi:MAG: lipid II:glycine glycyltransferase FemX [Aestuariivirga sp.]
MTYLEQDLPGCRIRASVPIAVSASNTRIVTDIPAERWDELVAEFADAAHEQTHALRGALWRANRVERVAVLREDRVIGLALAVTVIAWPLHRGIAYIKFGPLWRRRNEGGDSSNLVHVLDALVAHFVEKRRLCLKILPAADPDCMNMLSERLTSLGFSRWPLPDPNRFLVNLRVDEVQQRASLSKRWRYNLKHVLQHDLGIAVEPGADSLATFDRMFGEMERRKAYRSDSWLDVYARLKQDMPDAVRPSVIIVRQNGNAVAGAVIGHIGDIAYYLFGATSDRGAQLNAGYAMQWWIVGWLRQRGLRWYELGGEAGGPGMRRYKKGLVGKEGGVVALAGEFSLCRDPMSHAFAVAINGLRTAKSGMKALRAKLRACSHSATRPGET